MLTLTDLFREELDTAGSLLVEDSSDREDSEAADSSTVAVAASVGCFVLLAGVAFASVAVGSSERSSFLFLLQLVEPSWVCSTLKKGLEVFQLRQV